MEALKRRQQQVEEQKKKDWSNYACFVPFCDFLTYVNFLNLFCTRLWSFIEIAMLIQWIDSEIKKLHSQQMVNPILFVRVPCA